MKKTSIGSIADVRMGVTLRGRDATRPDPKGSFQMIRISDISDDGRLINPELHRIEPTESIRPDLVLRKGDVLFPNRGTRNTAIAFNLDEPNVIVGAQFFVIRPDLSVISPEYLAWILRSDLSVRHFTERRKGTLVQIVQRSDITDFEFPLPPLDTQRKIVSLHALSIREQELLFTLAQQRKLLTEHQLLEAAIAATSPL